MPAKKTVLLLTSAREPNWIDTAPTPVSRGLHEFVDKLNEEGDIHFAVSTLDKIDFAIDNGVVTVTDRYTGKDLRDYDMVHFRNATLYPDHARAIAIYLQHFGKLAYEYVDAERPEYGKLSQMVLFALNGLPVPNTWSSWHVTDTMNLYNKLSGNYPFILKANDGIKGHNNFLVRDETQLKEIMAELGEMQFVAQNFIPNDKDYRVLWFAQTPLIFSRSAAAGSHLNNTSRGGTSEEIALADFDPKALDIAREAGRLTRRSFSGADVMQNTETGDWYVLEVNAAPALTTGDLLDKKRSMYKKLIGELL